MIRHSIIVLLLGLQFGGVGLPRASAQSSSPASGTESAAEKGKATDESDRTRLQFEIILKELREIRAMLEHQQTQQAEIAARATPLPKIEAHFANDWHVLGKTSAPITVVEFTDLQCPICRAFELNTFPTFTADYIDRGKVKFVSLDLPLAMHPNSAEAAEAEQCAGDQGKFWEMRNALLSTQRPPTKSVAVDEAKRLGIDLPRLLACLDAGPDKDRVAAAAKEATALHIHATPTFLIGRVAHGRLTGVKVDGLDYSRFQFEIDKLLQEQK